MGPFFIPRPPKIFLGKPFSLRYSDHENWGHFNLNFKDDGGFYGEEKTSKKGT
jgi:hypothetical protein